MKSEVDPGSFLQGPPIGIGRPVSAAGERRRGQVTWEQLYGCAAVTGLIVALVFGHP